MVKTASYLRSETGHKTLDTSPFAINHSSLSDSDNNVLMARKYEFSCYLTSPRQLHNMSLHRSLLSFSSTNVFTSRMLLGVDVAGFEQIILVRPPNMVHSIVQVYSSRC